MSKTKLRDFLNFRSWQCQKRSCETSSIFEVDNVKKEAILRDFLQTCKVECRAGGLVPMRFVIFPLHLCKVLRLPRKSDASSYEVLHLSRKIILANLKIWCSKMQPPSGSQRPDLPTSLMNMSLVARLPRKMHLYRSSSNAPRLPSFLEMLQNLHVLLTLSHFWQGPQSLAPATRNDIWTSKSGPSMWSFYVFFTFWLRNVLRATTACTFSTLELPKVAQTWGVFSFFTCKCASRHNGVHFFDIVTAKSPDLVCFVHFDFEMCFAPQRRALFGFIRHLNFQNWSELVVFLAFSLANVLHATMACIFSTSQLQKSGLELRCFIHFDFEMCFAPQRRALFGFIRHLNFQNWSELAVFLAFSLANVLHATMACIFSDISTSKKWSGAEVFYTFWLGNGLRATTACNFSSLIWPAGSAPAALASLLFEPPEPQIIGKTQSFATLRLHLLSSDPFSSLTLPTPAFPSVHIVGSLTSKFPSGLYMYIHNYIYIYVYIYIWRDHTIWKAVGIVR